MDENEFNEPSPPDALTVAKRALVLATVSCRGFVESEKNDSQGASKLAKKSFDWLHALGLDEELSDWERKVLCTEFGRLEVRDKIYASWLAEGLVVIAWALQHADMPAYDAQCDPSAVANSLGFLQSESKTVLSKPCLHSSGELADYDEFVYNLHWRIRDFSLNRQSYDFESLARKAWGEPVLRFGLKLLEKDIQIGELPLYKVSDTVGEHLQALRKNGTGLPIG